MMKLTDTVKVLIIANVLFFLGSMTLGKDFAYSLFAMHFTENENFGFWQVLTSMFMHDLTSIGHIFFNMFSLFLFGSQLEAYLGQKRFLFVYFSAGLGATALSLLILYIGWIPGYEAFLNAGFNKPEIIQFMVDGQYATSVFDYTDKETIASMYQSYYTTAVGASGAIFGILAAFAVIFPNMELMLLFFPMPIKAKYLIGGYFALNVISAFSGYAIIGSEDTGFWAHIGGAIIGFICAWVWKKNSGDKYRWN